MTEKLLQFLWQFGYYNKASLTTSEGEPLTVIFPGTFNKNQGPDFTNAKVRIGKTTLAGTVELHLKTSDWNKHHHQTDHHYNNVILHVVMQHDQKVNDVPVLELGSRISNILLGRYQSFMTNTAFLPCGDNIQTINTLVFAAWKERLLIERLSRKATQVLQLLEQSNHHWEECFWWLLARSFGSKINSDAFESLAKAVPLNLMAKHKSSIHQLEALLFGQADLLNEEFEDDYPKLLQREYQFLKKKYRLESSVVPFLFLRMRPGNFPTIRLAQLAMLIHQVSHLFSAILEANSVNDVRNHFNVTANDFWHYHYTFRQTSSFKKKTLGAETINHIVINTVIPVLFAYGIFHKNEQCKDKAIRWLEELPAENNHITNGFIKAGVKNSSAYDSQSLLELKNAYCSEKRCLECSVGSYLLRETAHEYKVLEQPASV